PSRWTSAVGAHARAIEVASSAAAAATMPSQPPIRTQGTPGNLGWRTLAPLGWFSAIAPYHRRAPRLCSGARPSAFREPLLVLIAMGAAVNAPGRERSEEHTSELQSRVDLVCRLLLEKKKRT